MQRMHPSTHRARMLGARVLGARLFVVGGARAFWCSGHVFPVGFPTSLLLGRWGARVLGARNCQRCAVGREKLQGAASAALWIVGSFREMPALRCGWWKASGKCQRCALGRGQLQGNLSTALWTGGALMELPAMRWVGSFMELQELRCGT